MLESGTKEGKSPVNENEFVLPILLLKYFETQMARRNPGELTPKAKYSSRSIVNKYREGKVKSSPVRAMK